MALSDLLFAARKLREPIYFASGANHLGEVVGFEEIGHPFGITVRALLRQRDLESVLRAVSRSRVPVFVDSGAFSEVAPAPPFQVVDPIAGEEWLQILAVYRRLCEALGPLAYVVAPDQIGSQRVTLERLVRYRDQVRALRAFGANILLPLQRGERELAVFEDEARTVLGFEPVTAFPMKKLATTDEMLERYLRARNPAAVHLLGLGRESKRWPQVRRLFARLSPRTQISLDSVLIRAKVGRDVAGGRPLTRATDVQVQQAFGWEIGGETRRQAYRQQEEGPTLDWTEFAAEPWLYLGKAQLKEVGVRAGLGPSELRAWVGEPQAFFHADVDGRSGWEKIPEHVLFEAWRVHYQRAMVPEIKRRAIVRAFGEDR